MPLRPRVLVVFAVLMIPRPASPPAGAEVILRPYVRASSSDLQRVDRGVSFTRTLDSSDSREITTFGVIRVQCTIDTFVARLRDIEHFKTSQYVLEIGRFHAIPSLADVAGLTLDQSDRDAMRKCRPGSCGMRLPDPAIQRFKSVDWNNAAVAPAAAALAMREFLVDEARRYMDGGTAALTDYRDTSDALPRASAFKALLRPAAFHAEYQPELFAVLDRFPHLQIEGTDSFLYWSREKFGLKPTISITHSMVIRRPAEAVFASKQVFANHYFDASLGLSMFVPVAGASYGYVTYMNRTRVEGLHGPLAGIVRSIAGRRGRDGLARTLQDVKRKLEASPGS